MMKKSKIKGAIKKESKWLRSKGFSRGDVKLINGFARDVAVSTTTNLISTAIFATADCAAGLIVTGAKAGAGLVTKGISKVSKKETNEPEVTEAPAAEAETTEDAE